MENLEFFQTNNGNVQFSSDNGLSDAKNGDHFIIDDLLNFPTDDISLEAAFTGTSVDTSCNSSPFSTAVGPYFQGSDIGGPRTFLDGSFSNELGGPAEYAELAHAADLEWLSNFVDDSFDSIDLPKQPPLIIDGMRPEPQTNEISEIHQYQFQPGPEPEPVSPNPMIRSVPAKARSKRSRAPPGNWTSRLLVVSQTQTPPPEEVPVMTSSSSESNITVNKKLAKKKEVPETSGGEGRRCLHCDTDKTPQWRTGPLGPKTLCNACGVRYKSGRLVPEYRPASSPTFILSKHSNSHRKVLELRRQKEMMKSHQQQQFMHHHHQNMMFDVSNGADDYLIHQHIGPDYRQMI